MMQSFFFIVWTYLRFQGDTGLMGAVGPAGIKGEKGEAVWKLKAVNIYTCTSLKFNQ